MSVASPAASSRTALRPAGANRGVDVSVAAVARTAIRPIDGELARWNPAELAGVVGQEALERAGLDPAALDEVIVGCSDPVGACGADVARAIVLAAGWPVHIGGMVLDRAETSGTAAIHAATAAIRSAQARTVLVIGLGLCSVVPPGASALNRAYGAPWGGVAPRFAARGGLLPAPRLSERAAEALGIGRSELDAAADHSQRKRAGAGLANTAIVAVAAKPGHSASDGVYPRDPVSVDVLRNWGDAAELPPAFDPEGLLTAATFAPPADAVSAVLLQATATGGTATRRDSSSGSHTVDGPQAKEPAGRAAEDSTQARFDSSRPLATVVGVGRAAGDPFDPVGGVAGAVERALAHSGAQLDDVADIAVVEHDAATVILVAHTLGVDAESINCYGGAVATGNAAAAEELRLITDALAAQRSPGLLLTISAGPTGSAATAWSVHI